MKYRVVLGIVSGLSLLIVQSPIKAQQTEQWFNELATTAQSEQWVQNHQKALSENPNAVKSLSRELLAESLRQSPQVSPYAKAALEALLKYYPQADISEALHPWPWSQGLLIDWVKNAHTLAPHANPYPLQQQLDLCYRLGIRTCQAEMLYFLGENPQRLTQDRIASFVKGASIAQLMEHRPLSLLNQAALSDYADDFDDDTENFTNIHAIVAEAKTHKLSEVEAVATVHLANYLWNNDDAELSEIEDLLHQVSSKYDAPIFQANLLTVQAKIEQENGEVARARSNWVNALALLPPSYQRDKIMLLQNLIASYLEPNVDGEQSILQAKTALPYIDALLKEVSPDSTTYFKAKIQYVDALHTLRDKNAAIEQQQLETQLLGLPQRTYWEEQTDFAALLNRLGEEKKAYTIFESLLFSKAFDERQQVKILGRSQYAISKEAAARWALRFMSSDSFLLRSTAVNMLNQLKPAFLLPEMKDLLRSEDARVRSNMVQVIWYTQGNAALKDLLPLLQDNDVGVKENVLSALIKANYILPFKALEKELYSSAPQVRNKALQLLSQQPEDKQKLIQLASTPKSPLQLDAMNYLYQMPLTEKELVSFLPLLFSSDSSLRTKTEQLLQIKKPVSLAETLVQLMQKSPEVSDESIRLLAQWDAPLALKKLASWTKQSEQKKMAYVYLFSRAPMNPLAQPTLESLLAPQESLVIRSAAIIALLPSRNKTAWRDFSAFFNYPEMGKPLVQRSHIYQNIVLNTAFPPCLPLSAVENAPIWMNNASQEKFYLLKHWWLNTPALLWNGQQCVPAYSLSIEEKSRIKEKLQNLSNHSEVSVRQKALQYLNEL